ncbi:LPS O-antigen chain length determinant protein WzzB [Vibrio mimicus]
MISSQGSREKKTSSDNYYPSLESGVELSDLLINIWKKKWLVALSTFCFLSIASLYVFFAQEWWSAKATVSPPQIQDIAGYQQAVKQYQPLFDIYQEDGTVIVSETLDKLIDPEIIFKRFILEFNSNGAKRAFMQTDSSFLEIRDDLLKNKGEANLQEFYQEWFTKISAKPLDKKSSADDKNIERISLSLQSIDKLTSVSLLRSYVDFVNNRINAQLESDLNNTLNTRYSELKQLEKSLKSQAELRLKVELERTQYALDIAKSADVKLPVQNLGDNEIFAINIGYRALEAKLNALKSITDLSIFEPRISLLKSQISQFGINKISKKTDWYVSAFYYLQEPEEPIRRDKPKRTLIIVLSAIFGVMFGVTFVLVNSILNKKLISNEHLS